jgi:hypothetical protein
MFACYCVRSTLKRTVCLLNLDEDVLVGNEVYKLGFDEFHNGIYSEDYKLIGQFSIDCKSVKQFLCQKTRMLWP